MHILQHRLASIRRRWRFLVGLRGLFALAALVFGAAALIGLADWYIHLPSLIRAYGQVAILLGAGYVAYRWLLRPLATRCDDLSLALRIEEAYPELNDSLASTIQFIEQDDIPGSTALRNRSIDRTVDATAELDFGRILDRRGLLWCFLGATAALAVAGHFWWRHPDLARTAAWRLLDPFGQHTWTRIELDDVPTRIAIGQPFRLQGRVEGIVPEQVKVEIEGQEPQAAQGLRFDKRAEKIVPLKVDAKTGVGAIATALDVTQQRGKFRFRVLGNDGRYPPDAPWQVVEVLPPPTFADLNGLPSPQITLYPPEYAELPSPQKLSPGIRHLDQLVQGTHVVLKAAVDRPLRTAWIDLKPLDPGVRMAPWVAMILQPPAWDKVTLVATQQALAGRYPVALDDTRQILDVAFTPWITGSYVLHLVDADGLVKDYEADLRINLDPLPVVQVLRPTSSVSVLPDAEVQFQVLAEDDFFALRRVYLEVRRRDAEGKLLGEPQQLPLYDPALIGWMVARTPGALPLPVPGPELKLRPKRLELAKLLALNRQYREGEVLLVQACAEDFCNIVTPRPAGRSPEIEIRIVGRSELAKMIDEGLGQVQQELVRLQKLQQEALDLVKQLDKQKPNPKAMDRLIEAEQIQKQIQERIGDRPDQGLREQLGKLNSLIKDNKLPPNEATDNVRTLQSELNRLSQEELPRIEQNLAEARKEMAGTKKPAADPKQDPLKKASQLQEQAKEALDELARNLDRWADVNVVKGQLRDIISQQKDLAKQTDGLKSQQEEMAKQGDPKMQTEFREALSTQRDSQRDLANKTDDLQKRMEKVLDHTDKASKDFTPLGQKLRKAGRMEPEDRAKAFREIAKEARDLGKQQAEERAKENLDELAGDLEQAAKQLDQGKMSEDAQNDLQRQAQNKLKQAQESALPGPVKNLKEASKLAQESDVPRKMRDIAQNLEKPNLERARANQDEAIKNLEKMLAALEGQDDDGLDRLRKKQKELAQAGEDLDTLQKKTKETRAGQNPKEKADELRQRAQEAREAARQLARLQEEKASRELNRAAKLLEDAADKLDQGQQAEAEDLEREAMERMDEAQRELEQFQEELAREQLARIADRLKGLKERQDAAVERTRELHAKVVKSKEWSRGLRQTLDADKMTQEGLATETRSLQEKIKEAKVFAHVMDKAAQAMERAAEAIDQRSDEIEGRQIPFDEDDLKDEQRRHDEIAKQQGQAAARLQRLLDALKEEMQAQQQQQEQQQQQPMEGEQQARPRPADGIPQMAELKALRAEQVEINERTKQLAAQHPQLQDLPDPARREINELEAEQRRLREIFAGITAKQGDMP